MTSDSFVSMTIFKCSRVGAYVLLDVNTVSAFTLNKVSEARAIHVNTDTIIVKLSSCSALWFRLFFTTEMAVDRANFRNVFVR